MRLADELMEPTLWPNDIRNLGADMLRRLQAENEHLRAELEARKPLPPMDAIKLGMEAQQACNQHSTVTANWALAMTRFYERAHGIKET
jgi:hypothetical protein